MFIFHQNLLETIEVIIQVQILFLLQFVQSRGQREQYEGWRDSPCADQKHAQELQVIQLQSTDSCL